MLQTRTLPIESIAEHSAVFSIPCHKTSGMLVWTKKPAFMYNLYILLQNPSMCLGIEVIIRIRLKIQSDLLSSLCVNDLSPSDCMLFLSSAARCVGHVQTLASCTSRTSWVNSKDPLNSSLTLKISQAVSHQYTSKGTVLRSDGLILPLFHCLFPKHSLQTLLTLSYSAHFYFQDRRVCTPQQGSFPCQLQAFKSSIFLSLCPRMWYFREGKTASHLLGNLRAHFSQSFPHMVYLSEREQLRTTCGNLFLGHY